MKNNKNVANKDYDVLKKGRNETFLAVRADKISAKLRQIDNNAN